MHYFVYLENYDKLNNINYNYTDKFEIVYTIYATENDNLVNIVVDAEGNPTSYTVNHIIDRLNFNDVDFEVAYNFDYQFETDTEGEFENITQFIKDLPLVLVKNELNKEKTVIEKQVVYSKFNDSYSVKDLEYKDKLFTFNVKVSGNERIYVYNYKEIMKGYKKDNNLVRYYLTDDKDGYGVDGNWDGESIVAIYQE